ncbi:MAG: FkbM family methyltransferase, partial [Oscillospiraceae bacterium]|nr:FkbM family methyltransferase [Oscillospiraceae bacterium]
MLPSFITETQSSWEFLKNTRLPVFIYGMGDGAVKILNVFDRYGIAPAGFFASDEFVRGHSFMGHLVHKLSDIENAVDDFIAVLAFGAGYRSLYDRILDIASRHTLLAPDVPVIGDTLFTPEFCSENAEKLQAVYDLLADDLSRQTYADVINSKISGKIGYLDRC